MNDKPFEIVYSYKLNTENIKVGMYLLDRTENPKLWYIDEQLIGLMKGYEKETSKLAIIGNKITGMFLEFKGHKDNPEK